MNLKVTIALLLGFASSFVRAQEVSDDNSIMKPKDPIVTMLDSLVTLKNVIRYTESNSLPNGIDKTVPVYTDEETMAKMAKISTPIPMTFNKQVKDYINLYAYKRGALTARVSGLSRLYFPTFEQTLDKYGIPIEFKYLSIVESALNPTAVSPMGASGIWQFMYNTGKLYNLNINSYIDERRDVALATDAACRYFKEMYEVYGDWLLVVASYNCGPGNVNRAIARAGGSKNFWEISKYLPAETRGYVPAFIAVTYVMNYSKDFNISPVAPAFCFYEIDTIGVKNKISFKQLSLSLDVPYDVLAFLNPTYKKGIIPGEGYKLSLPANKIALYIANEENIYNQSGKELEPTSFALKVDNSDQGDYNYKRVKKYFKVKRGESLYQFADRTDCSAKEVKKWNRLKSTKLKSGQSLMVYANVKQKKAVKRDNDDANIASAKKDSSKSNDSTVAVTSTTNDSLSETANVVSDDNANSGDDAQVASAEKGTKSKSKYVYHLVQPGDTLWNIAKRYDGVTVEMIKQVNNLTSKSMIKVGSKIKVPSNTNG